MGITDFTYDSNSPGTQNLIEEMSKGRLDLGNFFTIVASMFQPSLPDRSCDIASAN